MFNYSKYYESDYVKPTERKNLLKKVLSSSDIPEGKHFAIIGIYTSSYTVPGDERSRTNPGHGYPEHTVKSNNMEYWVCESEEIWKEVIAEFYAEQAKPNSYSDVKHQTIIPIKVEGKAVVKTEYVVKVN